MANSTIRRGMRKVLMSIARFEERVEYVDACIASLSEAIATEPTEVDQECLAECKAVKNEMASPYGMLNNLRR